MSSRRPLISCSVCRVVRVGTLNGGGGAFLPISWNDAHLPEWVADEGNRVFFDSQAPLVAQDTNGRQDVYEWEREGTGSCTAASAVNGGCQYLLSGGTSEADSWFIGASESGDDVFVASRANLAPRAGNEAFNLFDARVGGVQPVTEPLCTGTGCQGPPEPAPTFATPASVTFNGVGNFPPPVEAKAAVKPRPKAKPKPKAKHCPPGFLKRTAAAYASTQPQGTAMISASSFWGRIEEMVLRIVAGILDRRSAHLRLARSRGCAPGGSLSVERRRVAQAEEPLPDGRVFEMVTPPNNQDANVYVPFAFEASISQGVQDVLPVSGCA